MYYSLFQGLYQNPNVLFELKGVHIHEKQYDLTDISDQQLSAVPLEANHVDAEITTIHIPLLCHIFLEHLFFHYQILWVLEFTDSR